MPCGTQRGASSTARRPRRSAGWWNVRFGATITGWASGNYLVADAAFLPSMCGGGDDGGGAPPAAPTTSSRCAKLAVGYSYYWGHGSWRDDGASVGSCSGSCPSCTHIGPVRRRLLRLRRQGVAGPVGQPDHARRPPVLDGELLQRPGLLEADPALDHRSPPTRSCAATPPRGTSRSSRAARTRSARSGSTRRAAAPPAWSTICAPSIPATSPFAATSGD